MTFAALAFLYTWSIGEYAWSTWYQAFTTAILVAASIVMWWARMAGRKVLKKNDPRA
jgi:membrane protein implicated in regulation of membrane protease activity